MPRPRKNRIGERHGMLLVIAPGKVEKTWVCKCDCGNTIVLSSKELTGTYCRKQCGCKQKSHSQKKFQGCDEDCFNCPFDECYKPDYLCTYIPEVTPTW